MTIYKALKQISYKLQNVWKTSDLDQEAINAIYKFVNDKHKDQINDYQLFAKLYITFYGELLRYYKTDVFDKEPQKAIHKILDTPMQTIIEKFIEKAWTEEERIQRTDKKTGNLKSLLEQRDIKILNKMTYQEAEDNLTAMINLAINKYN